MIKHLFFLIGLSTSLCSQEIRIVEILDSNLFRTEDSTLVRMVNLEVPSISEKDSVRQVLAGKAVTLARIHLLKQKLRFEETYKNSCFEDSIKAGHLFRIYPLSDKNINELYLEKGYAVYIPCDTLYMDHYREAGLKSMNNNLGIWQPYLKRKPNMLNRLRFSFILIEQQFEDDDYFPPLFGINYRWSDLISVIKKDAFHLNISAETGTLIYLALPYLNIGSEMRFGYFYSRVHYDALLPIFFFINGHDLDTIHYWGFDMGFVIPLKNGNGIEVEFNSKRNKYLYFNYISISFAAY